MHFSTSTPVNIRWSGRPRRHARTALAGLVLGLAVSAPASAATALDSAPVPSLCDHPAGKLVNGELPGIPENQGGVSLGAIAKGTIHASGDMAAVVSCNRGGVGWPDNVVVYDRTRKIIGTVELRKVTRGGRETVDRIRISGRTVFVDVVNIAQKGDAQCCGSASALLKLRWNAGRKRVVVASQTRYTERRTVTNLLSAVRAGRRSAAAKLATPDVVDELWQLRAQDVRLKFSGCYGQLDDQWWITDDADWVRACTFGVTFPGRDGEQAWTLHVDRSGRHGFKVTGIQAVAG